MDKRFKPSSPEKSIRERQALFAALRDGELSLADAVKRMRRLSKLTQPEFAAHRGISVKALRQIESGQGNPTVETLNKIGSIFGVEVGFVPRIGRPLKSKPNYEPDDGPLNDGQLAVVRADAAKTLPQGRLVFKASLLD